VICESTERQYAYLSYLLLYFNIFIAERHIILSFAQYLESCRYHIIEYILANRLNHNNILLVHPLGYRPDLAKDDISRKANMMPPIGLASIAAYLEQKSFTADIIDCFAKPGAEKIIGEYLQHQRPGFIGISTTTSSFLDGVRIAKIAKALLPGIKVIFGGPHVSALKKETLAAFPMIDLLVVGEGEETLAELMACETEPPSSIEGVVYRDESGEPVFSGYRQKGVELDTLPYPAYEKLAGYPDKYYLPIFSYPQLPNASCISSRGCPYSCSYCDRSVFRQTFRFNSAEYLYHHLLYLRDRFGIRHVNFYDDQFTFHRGRIKAFAQQMVDHPIGVSFNCAARAEHLDLELLQLMKAAGCWMISLGVESGDEALLARHRQNPDRDMLAEKIRLIHRVGIRVKALMMIGLPGETEASIHKSIQYVSSLPIDDLNVAKFTPFPGSPIYESIHEKGEFDENWEKMDCMHFQFIPNGLTRKQLDDLFLLFYKTHFKRPRILWNHVAMLWQSPDSWRQFLKNLPLFLKFAVSNKRITEP